jgi:hypothetical protein
MRARHAHGVGVRQGKKPQPFCSRSRCPDKGGDSPPSREQLPYVPADDAEDQGGYNLRKPHFQLTFHRSSLDSPLDDDLTHELREPLSSPDAKALIRRLLERGQVRFSGHALQEMAHDPFGPISKVDVVNVLRGGVVDPGELRHGTWRYPVRTARLCVVVAFRGASIVVIVTSWRNKS